MHSKLPCHGAMFQQATMFIKKNGPGLLLVALCALAARTLHDSLPKDGARIIGDVVIGLIIGLVLGNAGLRKPLFMDGLNFSFSHLLKWAIVMLAVQITFATVLKTGLASLGLIVALMLLATASSMTLGHLLKVPPRLSGLIAIGTAVCGNTAISAVSPAIGASDSETSFAIATNTLFGTLAVLLYPLMGHALDLDQTTFGTWAGLAVNDTSQVVAAGFAYGEEAANVATTVKLTRNSLLGVVVIVAGLVAANCTSAKSAQATHTPWYSRLKLPGFVVAFLVVALLNSLGAVTWLEDNAVPHLTQTVVSVAKWLILMALVAVGCKTDVRSMMQIGYKPFLLGLTAGTVNAVVALLGVSLLSDF